MALTQQQLERSEDIAEVLVVMVKVRVATAAVEEVVVKVE